MEISQNYINALTEAYLNNKSYILIVYKLKGFNNTNFRYIVIDEEVYNEDNTESNYSKYQTNWNRIHKIINVQEQLKINNCLYLLVKAYTTASKTNTLDRFNFGKDNNYKVILDDIKE